MAIEKLIQELSEAETGVRVLDGPIGLAVGWTRKVEYLDEHRGAKVAQKVNWYLPNGAPGKIPPFTGSVDAAVLLLKIVAPHATWGVSYEKGRARAIIGDGPYSKAATPALALCIAALRLKLIKGGGG